MSTIEKLYIQGVRSFGTNAEDAQSITFSSPITLILGQNGCGKTTIIECLKYALTGECPPGSDSGKSFVHDPKIFGRRESLAQVKMIVRDKSDARLSICRSMKVTIASDKATFKTIDSTLTQLGNADDQLKNNNKNKNNQSMGSSMSLRNANTDQAISVFMGVSKAIINSVLFCHQEDSSWPLDEGKKVKLKFDAIFGITEYNKALDNIIGLEKKYGIELKVMEANIKLLAHLKKEMDDKTLSLQKYEQQCDDIKKQCEKCDEELKPVDARLQEIRDIECEISKYSARKVEMDTMHKNCKEQIGKLTRNIKKKFEGSLAELDLEIQSFNQRMSEMRIQHTEVKEQLMEMKNSNVEIQKTLGTQDKELYVAKQKQKSEQECKMQLTKNINKFCEQLQIKVDRDVSENAEKLEEMLSKQLEIKQCEITEVAEENEQSDKTRQFKIDELRTEITKSEQSLKTQEKQKLMSEQESEALELKIEQIEASFLQLKALDKQITNMDEQYERLTQNFNQESARENIAKKKSSIAEKQTRFKHLDKQLTFLSSISKLMAEINLKEKELEKKKQEIHRVKSKHSQNFSTFFKDPITSNYRRALQNAYDKLRREIQDLNQKANAQKLKEQSYEIERKNLLADIAKMEKELQQFEERIYQKCRSTSYDELILRSKATIAKLQLEHGALKSSEAMYNRYIQKINECPDCPLCHRNMSSDEACDLTTELTDEIQKLPDNISRSEKSLKAEQLKYEDLLQIKPAIDKVKELKENLPQKKEKLRKIEELLGDSVAEYETQMSLLGEPTCNMELANSMLGDMTLLDEALKESGRFTKDLEQLKVFKYCPF
ncbi:DNA repair protein RAD50 isoform X2 [Drosophila innubila]|uniref:DNA repair protein RAD50 isoform X2 n=1 Tax=Drosophila innubila TaxID=198719 RepID=UPI00148BB9E5|nr:DNA repair protein RAD50 isoform X2 [Drosophila innubila]